MYKRILFAGLLLALNPNAIFASDASPSNCNTGLVDGNNYYTLKSASISSITVLSGRVRVIAAGSGCNDTYYFDKTDNQLLSLLLTAKASGGTVNLYFLADQNSPDISLGGITATKFLSGAEINPI